RYREAKFDVNEDGEFTTKLELITYTVEGTVKDAYTDKPLADVKVAVGDVTTKTDANGKYSAVVMAQSGSVSWQIEGYVAARQPYGGSQQLDVKLRPSTLAGIVTDSKSGQPIGGATVTLGEQVAKADDSGRYALHDVPEQANLVVKAAGYEAAKVAVDRKTEQDVKLDPFVVRAAYLTYYGVGDDGLRNNVIDLIDSTELNAVVIDIKGDFGKIAYKSDVPLAQAIEADAEPTIPDIEGLLRTLKEKGIYTIARIVVFKDDMLGRNGPAAGVDVAVRNASTGGPWIDGENLVWVDPFREEVWDYNTALAVEAAKKGFDEIQFDYIRFPTDPSPGSSVNAAVFSDVSNEANRTTAIVSFLSRARTALQKVGANLSVDVFGYTCWREDDMGIGQNIEQIAKYVDYISPMVYPSTYSDGLPMEPNYMDAPAYPYEIVYYSIERAVERLGDSPTKIRPWLQYFDDYPWASGREYNAPQIEAQKQASVEAGGYGFLLWDPTNRFSRGGLEPE
ncbi:MAG: carboxypeptidase regulatory-like domain-containing protein, partial [Dehalococcoidales bacterium]|nr:carboxypeptidase regulatory-like domain-containing protein [Dehalococcoidales bacterium]